MKIKSLETKVSLLVMVVFLLSACQKNQKIEATYLPNEEQSPVGETKLSATGPETAQPIVVPQNVSVGGAGVNPEHGKPGHRCDLAVGAPLNSAPQSAPATTSQEIEVNPSQITSTPQKVSAQTQKVAPGMNPPHGEPGHRCDISVGQPLNSKPAAKNVVQTTSNNTAEMKPQNVTMSAPANTESNSIATAPGMNPPHGQAGHRCDISVGQPLPAN